METGQERAYVNLNTARKNMMDSVIKLFIDYYNEFGIDWQQDQNPRNKLLYRFLNEGLKKYGIVMEHGADKYSVDEVMFREAMENHKK